MKRILLFTAMLMMALGISAQRAAVMEFKAGAGISQADVDGISAIFITYFRPVGYTMVERTQIDRIIEEQGFQRSSLTESQMVRIGQILNVSKIVIGDVNVVMGQYNVDVRVINVQSGTIAATEGATFSAASYRTTMQTLAQNLAGKIAISAGPTVSAPRNTSSASARTRSSVETVYGYLHVFPNELGVFQSEPSNVIANINAQKMHGYNDWRLPTNEELSLLLANGYLSGAEYMSKEKPAGMVLLVTTGKSVAEKEAIEAIEADLKRQGLVDLGLPSGTLWRNENEGGKNVHYSYNEAVSKFGNKLPTKEQLEELKNQCTWTWTGSGYKVVGPNGNSIYLPAAGYRTCIDNVYSVGSLGYYWSSTPSDSVYAYRLCFDYYKVYTDDIHRCDGFSVRLVQY